MFQRAAVAIVPSALSLISFVHHALALLRPPEEASVPCGVARRSQIHELIPGCFANAGIVGGSLPTGHPKSLAFEGR